jgi:hypothetical protein
LPKNEISYSLNGANEPARAQRLLESDKNVHFWGDVNMKNEIKKWRIRILSLEVLKPIIKRAR